MEVLKVLQETITSSTTRKGNVDKLIEMITKEKDVEGKEKPDNDEEEEEQFVNDGEDGSSDFSSEEEESSSEDWCHQAEVFIFWTLLLGLFLWLCNKFDFYYLT